MKPSAGKDPDDGTKNIDDRTMKPGGPHYPKSTDVNRKPCGGNREPDTGGI